MSESFAGIEAAVLLFHFLFPVVLVQPVEPGLLFLQAAACLGFLPGQYGDDGRQGFRALAGLCQQGLLFQESLLGLFRLHGGLFGPALSLALAGLEACFLCGDALALAGQTGLFPVQAGLLLEGLLHGLLILPVPQGEQGDGNVGADGRIFRWHQQGEFGGRIKLLESRETGGFIQKNGFFLFLKQGVAAAELFQLRGNLREAVFDQVMLPGQQGLPLAQAGELAGTEMGLGFRPAGFLFFLLEQAGFLGKELLKVEAGGPCLADSGLGGGDGRVGPQEGVGAVPGGCGMADLSAGEARRHQLEQEPEGGGSLQDHEPA